MSILIISSSSRPVESLRARGGKQSFESIRHTAWRRIFPAPHYQHYQLLKISLSFIFLSLISYSYSYSISIERCAHNVHTSFAHCDVFWNKYTYICRKPPIWAAFLMLLKSQILCTSRDKSHIFSRIINVARQTIQHSAFSNSPGTAWHPANIGNPQSCHSFPERRARSLPD